MRNPNVVLESLTSHAKTEDYKFERIYRNLYNPQFFLAAYNKIYANKGNMTEGSDGKTIDGMSLERINNIIEKLKNESYQPNPARRTYIPKKNGDKRPLGIPSIDDKLVQEVIRVILEAIYEPTFSTNSHAFRPRRSCHTALIQCKERFNGVRWFIEGDIKGFFDNIDHQNMIGILRKRIADDKFIRLIWKFLRAGYLEDWTYHMTYSGTPQGGILSPILSNIYLNELDKYMDKYKSYFDKGKERKVSSEYEKLKRRVQRFKNKHKTRWHQLSQDDKKVAIKEYKRLVKEQKSVAYFEPMDDGFKRLQYIRYADDFIIGVIGSKEDAVRIKADITKFLANELKLTLSQEKTLITHSGKMAKFLGYHIVVSRQQATKRRADGSTARTNNYKAHLYLPKEAWVNKIKELNIVNFSKGNEWKTTHRNALVDHDDLEILSIFNAEIKGLYEYYKLANNVSTLHKFKYLMEYSMYKTYGRKYQKSVRQIRAKFNVNGKFAVRYETKNGPKVRFFYDEGFQKQKETRGKSNQVNDVQPPKFYFNSRSSLIESLTANKCEYCGATNVPIEIHHVKKLKDLKGKKKWEQFMIARKRKTVPLCLSCHDKLHAGKLD